MTSRELGDGSPDREGTETLVGKILGWITTPEQAAGTLAGAFTMGVADGAANVLPQADTLASAGLGALGGLSIMLAAGSINSYRSRKIAKALAESENQLREEVKALVRLLASKDLLDFSYDLEDTYQLYKSEIIDREELDAWLGTARDRLRLLRPSIPSASA